MYRPDKDWIKAKWDSGRVNDRAVDRNHRHASIRYTESLTFVHGISIFHLVKVEVINRHDVY